MYQVGWAISARHELAELWVEGDSELRESITTAAAQIDALLSQSAGEVGESRSGNRRIAFVPPLGLALGVNESTRRAKVLHVWLM